MKLAWATDIHLDCCKPSDRITFATEVAVAADAVVLSGDISTHLEADLLGQFARLVAKPVYFVLGNHDFWGGSFETTERYIRQLCSKHRNLWWLTESSPIKLTDDVELCGVEGWYDGRIGDWERSPYHMNDWEAVHDWMWVKQRSLIIASCRGLAERYAYRAESQLKACKQKRAIFVTHVPPYDEVSRHDGEENSRFAKPFYTNVTMGDALSEIAFAYPERQFTTLCGHSHDRAEFQEAPNHRVLCGRATYGRPQIERIFDLDLIP